MSEPYFPASEVTEEIHKQPGHRWCKCDHVEGTHFADTGPYRCHATFCYCRQFTHDTSLWSRIKRKIKINPA